MGVLRVRISVDRMGLLVNPEEIVVDIGAIRGVGTGVGNLGKVNVFVIERSEVKRLYDLH
jgi:hypothetical protein